MRVGENQRAGENGKGELKRVFSVFVSQYKIYPIKALEFSHGRFSDSFTINLFLTHSGRGIQPQIGNMINLFSLITSLYQTKAEL